MEDPTNQFNSGSSMPQASAHPSESSAGSAAALKQPRVTDEAAWLMSCRAAFPWQPLSRIAAGKTSPILWGSAESAATDTAALLTKLHQAGQAARWRNGLKNPLEWFLKDAAIAEISSATNAREAVAWAYLLPVLAKHEKTNLILPALRQLLELTDASLPSATADDALVQLWLKVELPLILACLAPDAKTAISLRKGALGAESRLANAWFDPFGLPTKDLAKLLRPWSAALVRAHELLRKTDIQFSDAARERLERLARHVLRLSRPDGSSVLQAARGTSADREFLTAAVLTTTSTPSIAALAFGKGSANPKPVKGMPAAALYSPKSSLAVLRNRWAAPQVQATLDFSGPQVWLDVSCGNQPLLHGNWEAAVQINGEAAPPLGPWTEVCWHSDADCDYIEIEQKLSGGFVLQRHVLLVRRDECLLLADSLLNEAQVTPEEFLATAAHAPQVQYAANLHLAPGLAFAPQKESREGHLAQGRKPYALVLPLALPEWRKQPVSGELATAEGVLQHRLQARGRNLFAPLWLDLNPARFKNAQLTWRQLTVGESLQIQPREVAVGYRVQVHYSQWLLYRSLAWRGNRTVLGKNFATDLACCRFQPNGETQEILEVQ